MHQFRRLESVVSGVGSKLAEGGALEGSRSVGPLGARRGAEPSAEEAQPWTRESFLPFGAPQIEEEDIEEVAATLRSGWLGAGQRLQRFERSFAAYRRAEHVVGMASASSALHLSLVASGIGAGDEVLTSAMTYCATVNAILHAGARPVPVDVDPLTWNIDPAAVERAITPRTKALVPVHFAGRPCDMDALVDIARRHDLVLIEDCAHAIEAEHRGRAAGTFGAFGCFSFAVGKNLTTGEGGMVIAADAERAARVRRLSHHGLEKNAWERFGGSGFQQAWVVEAGFKGGMTDLQAALGLGQLARIERNRARRVELWQRYEDAFADLPLQLPARVEAHQRHALHLFSVLVDEQRAGLGRDELVARILARGVGVGVHYPCVAEHPHYQAALGWSPAELPVATRIGRTTLSLPFSPALSDQDVADVVRAVRCAFGASARIAAA